METYKTIYLRISTPEGVLESAKKDLAYALTLRDVIKRSEIIMESVAEVLSEKFPDYQIPYGWEK